MNQMAKKRSFKEEVEYQAECGRLRRIVEETVPYLIPETVTIEQTTKRNVKVSFEAQRD